MFVNPAALIAAAKVVASATVPASETVILTAAAREALFLIDSAMVMLYVPAANVEAVTASEVIVVAPVAFLRHVLNVAVAGLSSYPPCSSLFV